MRNAVRDAGLYRSSKLYYAFKVRRPSLSLTRPHAHTYTYIHPRAQALAPIDM
jgi:hypothetical protein